MGQLRIEIVPVTPLQQNCTLMWDTETMAAVVVDPGGDAPTIAARVEALGLKVERILLTHGHLDHAGGAAELRDLLHVAVEGPDQRDQFLLDTLDEDGKRWNFETRRVTPERYLAEGDTIALGAHRFDVLHVPGHTPGHIVFVERTARFAQVGDTLFNGSVGRTDFPYGNHETLIAGIRNKLLPLGDDVRFVCGHGATSSIGEERRRNPFLRA
jgi:glyoxylase-like metal-dependent hydrolase (beta-lactamase superfamily II)